MRKNESEREETNNKPKRYIQDTFWKKKPNAYRLIIKTKENQPSNGGESWKKGVVDRVF